MTTKEHRKAIPLHVKLHACLLLLGFTDEDIAAGLCWDHSPPLGLRAVVDGVMTPAPNDPHHLRPMSQADHARQTFGPSKATSAGGDIHAIAKVKRLNGETKKKPKRAWASRKFQLRSK